MPIKPEAKVFSFLDFTNALIVQSSAADLEPFGDLVDALRKALGVEMPETQPAILHQENWQSSYTGIMGSSPIAPPKRRP